MTSEKLENDKSFASAMGNISLMTNALRGDFADFKALGESQRFDRHSVGMCLRACVNDSGEQFEILNYLLDSYADCIFQDEINEAFINACNHGSHRVIGLLLKHGADVNAVSKLPIASYTATPLLVAARCGREDVVRLLIRHGVDPSLSGQPDTSSVERILKSGNKGWQDARAVVILMEALEMPLTDKVGGKTLLAWFTGAAAKDVIRDAQRHPRSQAMAASIEAAMGDMDTPSSRDNSASGPSL